MASLYGVADGSYRQSFVRNYCTQWTHHGIDAACYIGGDDPSLTLEGTHLRTTAMKGPLDGIRVLECAIMIVGPEAAAMMGDLGAEVIKVEDRVQGDPVRGIVESTGIPSGLPSGSNYFYELANRNKRSITLDITKAEGQQVVYRLASHCDVFIQNFRPGVAERCRLDYGTLSKGNPRLVYASGSGFGSQGPDAQQPSIDMMGLARGAWMTHVGEEGHPPLFPGMAIADQIAARTLGWGILAALIARERTGVGQEVETSMLGSVIDIQAVSIAGYLLMGRELNRPVRRKARNPLWSYYRCSDDRWIALGMSQSDRYWRDFCRAIDRPELADDPLFSGWKARAKNCEQLISILDDVFATRTIGHWLQTFRERGDFLVQPVQYHHELPSDPQVIANGYVVDFDHPELGRVKMPGCPVRFSATPAGIRSPAPEFGQHTEDVLLNIGGYSWEEIAALKEREII